MSKPNNRVHHIIQSRYHAQWLQVRQNALSRHLPKQPLGGLRIASELGRRLRALHDLDAVFLPGETTSSNLNWRRAIELDIRAIPSFSELCGYSKPLSEEVRCNIMRGYHRMTYILTM